MTDRLALPRRYRNQLETLLREHVPGVEVWAYGSRVNGESHDGSDLDLALRGPALEPLDGGYYDLVEAIEKSSIPILVQTHDWAMLPESFHREIERDHVVVQEGMGTHTKAREWREVTLAEAPIAIIDGDRGKNYPKQHEFLESGHCLFLNAGNVTSDGFNFSSCAFVSSDRDQRLRKGKLNRHDVVLTTRGTVGNSAYFDATISYEHVRINSGMVILRALQPALHPRYLYVLTQSQLFLSQVQALRTGSAQPQLPIRDIERITIPLPPLPEQRAIAHVLGTLDDKIELNRRMNETLEAMARALFKSWFVDFEPVRAKMAGRWRRGESLPGLPAERYDLFPDRLVDSELGEIPEGWEVKTLGEVLRSTNERVGDQLVAEYACTTDGLVPRAEMFMKRLSRSAAKNKIMRRNQLVFGLSRRVLNFGLMKDDIGCVSPVYRTYSVDEDVLLPELLEAAMRANPDYFYLAVSSSSREGQSVSEQALFSLEVVVPERSVQHTLHRMIQDFSKHSARMSKESLLLANQRDALLPRLVSGELRLGNS